MGKDGVLFFELKMMMSCERNDLSHKVKNKYLWSKK